MNPGPLAVPAEFLYEQHKMSFQAERDRPENADRTGLLKAAAEAYRMGLQVLPRNSFEVGRVECRKLLNAGVMERLSASERTLSARCKHYYTKAREAAGRGDVGVACQFFGLAKAIADSSDLSREAQLLCAADIAAAEAYLDYCCEYYEQAIVRLHESLALDESLENEFGYRVLHAHRLHLVNNLIRTEARFSGSKAAMQLARCALAYLLGRSKGMPVPGTWGQDRLLFLPKEVIAMMFAQATGEIALLLAGIEREQAAELFDIVAGEIDASTNGDFGEKQAGEWLRIKRLFCSGDINGFLLRAARFLAEGPGDTVSLWQTVALDLACLCNGDRASRSFTEMILESAASWKPPSRSIQHVVSKLSRHFELRASSPALGDAQNANND